MIDDFGFQRVGRSGCRLGGPGGRRRGGAFLRQKIQNTHFALLTYRFETQPRLYAALTII